MSDWIFDRNELSDSITHFRILDSNQTALSFAQVIELWVDKSEKGASFRNQFSQCLSESAFPAFKWETPVVDLDRLSREFEFVLLNSPGLDRKENPTAFGQHFQDAPDTTKTLRFPNLGRNAVMVVPTPSRDTDTNHCHLAAFLRTASLRQADDFWSNIGLAMQERVSNKPVWLSTAGGGVAWLHGRLADRPKYYGYQPFKNP